MSEKMAQRIRILRQQRGLTLEQVADVVGVGKSTVRKWETGMIANMRRDKIADLAKALGTTPAYLMGWNEESNINKEQPIKYDGLSKRKQYFIEKIKLMSEEEMDRLEKILQIVENTK